MAKQRKGGSSNKRRKTTSYDDVVQATSTAPNNEKDMDDDHRIDEDVVRGEEEVAPAPASKKKTSDEDEHKQASGTVAVPPPPASITSDGRYHNKQRCLVVCSRGVTARYRHLLEDWRTLMPHHKKESKLDCGGNHNQRSAILDICNIRGCNSLLFLECRKRGQDAYLWLATNVLQNGPSAKFLLSNVHTMDELKLTGNCMKHSRPILNFDIQFDQLTHLKLLKQLFITVFGTPRGHPKSKPFIDRVMSFYYADHRIWVRNYQIVEEAPANAREEYLAKKRQQPTTSSSLVEIGPRIVLEPIRIFQNTMGGPTLYENTEYVSPNTKRAMERHGHHQYDDRKRAQEQRKERKSKMVLPDNPLDSVFRS